MPHHHHSSKSRHKGSLFIPQHPSMVPFPMQPSIVPFPMNTQHHPSMVPFPMQVPQYPGLSPFQIPNGYMPFLVPRTFMPFSNSINNSINKLKDIIREINDIGIIFITPKGILFIKNMLNELTIPYGNKYSYESNDTAVLRIFKDHTGFNIDEGKIREKITYDRLRSTGIIAKVYLIYTSQDNENEKVKYIKYNNDFDSLLYQKFVRTLFRDLIDRNDIKINI